MTSAVLDKVTDSVILLWGHALAEVGPYVDVVAQGDDVCIPDFIEEGMDIPSHDIRADTTPDRIDAMFRSVMNFGRS